MISGVNKSQRVAITEGDCLRQVGKAQHVYYCGIKGSLCKDEGQLTLEVKRLKFNSSPERG
jgi:hypothetical protein